MYVRSGELSKALFFFWIPMVKWNVGVEFDRLKALITVEIVSLEPKYHRKYQLMEAFVCKYTSAIQCFGVPQQYPAVLGENTLSHRMYAVCLKRK